MKLIPFYGKAWESNSYLLINGERAILIDAGVPHEEVTEHLEREGAKLQYILLTHGHFDHIISAERLREQTAAQLAIHKADAEMLTDAQKSAEAIFFGTNRIQATADVLLSDGDTIAFGDTSVRVLHTPGHSLGSVCYLVGDMLFSGDTLFDGGYGRFDLYGGDAEMLSRSLGKLREMDADLTVYPGHSGCASLGQAIGKLLGTY